MHEPEDLLPDSRLRDRSFGNVHGRGLGNHEPVFCIHCGAPGGVVTAALFDKVVYVCNECVRSHGPPPLQEVPEGIVKAS